MGILEVLSSRASGLMLGEGVKEGGGKLLKREECQATPSYKSQRRTEPQNQSHPSHADETHSIAESHAGQHRSLHDSVLSIEGPWSIVVLPSHKSDGGRIDPERPAAFVPRS